MAAATWMQPPAMAELALRWLEEGVVDRVLKYQRQGIGERVLLLTEGLGGMGRLRTRPGCLHAWLELPPPWSGEQFARSCADCGVQLVPSRNFSPGDRPSQEAVRICLGLAVDNHQVKRGAAIIASLLAGPPPLEPPLM